MMQAIVQVGTRGVIYATHVIHIPVGNLPPMHAVAPKDYDKNIYTILHFMI
jgi:hypothetical protein